MNQKIALVDDDRNILTSISMALEREGFKVQTYIDAETALVGITRSPPNLAVIDIKMPRMDGWSFLEEFITIKPACAKDIELFLVTSSIDFRDKERALGYTQVNDFRVKPVTFEEMEGILMDLA